MAAGRTLHVRCNTWEQVEVFHTRKLRRGKLLSMKVPFQTEVGAQVTLGLELPNQVVMAIDGIVLKASTIEGDTKTWIEVELAGFTEDVVAKIRAMASGAELPPEMMSPPVPTPHTPKREQPVPSDDGSHERQLFTHLTAELRRLRQAAVHEVLGVPRDARPDEIRRGWMNLVRRHHPDLVARHGAPAITHLAEELTILTNRAYDRLRAVMVAEGRAVAVGSMLQQPAGWLVGLDDIDGASRPNKSTQAPQPQVKEPEIVPAQGSEAFEVRARTMLSNGEADTAQEVLAAALVVYPRSKPLRSLYYVASAMAALHNNEVMLAMSQLETALAHFDQCVEAADMLEHVRTHGSERTEDVRRFFR
jgi:DnaJ-domain-containing protein 1